MTVAEKAIVAHTKTRIAYLVAGWTIAAIMVFGGWRITQRQIDVLGGEQPKQIELEFSKEQFKLKSTYPGLVLIVCGTWLAAAIVLKKFHFKTQHQDSESKIPGYTELDS